MEDYNYILIEDDIVKSISFNGGNYVTISDLVDTENTFNKRSLKKNKFKIINGAQETHELFWQKYSVEVAKASNVSATEIISLTKL